MLGAVRFGRWSCSFILSSFILIILYLILY
nr:MAG TPA: hypothetical protein [Caudoviricetes sp.]